VSLGFFVRDPFGSGIDRLAKALHDFRPKPSVMDRSLMRAALAL
jgi:hypothetical protein